MPVLKRELHRTAKGPVMNDEDWWRLAYDTETKRLYVEHEWAHTDVRRGGHSDDGKVELEITEFLNQGGHRDAHRALVSLITALFEDHRDA